WRDVVFCDFHQLCRAASCVPDPAAMAPLCRNPDADRRRRPAHRGATARRCFPGGRRHRRGAGCGRRDMTGHTVINVGAAPAAFSGKALYLDGDTADLRPVELCIDEAAGALSILASASASEPVVWPLADVRTVPDQADPDRIVLALAGDPVARMIVEDGETARLLRARCPNLRKRPKPRGLR